MRPFPGNPFLSGNFAPLLLEGEAHDVPIVGEIPKQLAGTLYRNGPNPQFPPLDERHHWFLGDGMVHALRVEGGRVSWKNRWVRTRQFALERAAGRRLFSSFFALDGGDPSVADEKRNVANTNVLLHHGRLLALEEGNPPIALDPASLDTEGPQTFGGRYDGPLTAHPKVDPRTGELFFFGYQAGGPASPQIAFGVVSAEGVLTRLERFDAPYAAMVHDFAITDRHVIFPVFPATIDVERIMKGGPLIAWNPEKPSAFGVLARDGKGADVRWFRGAPSYVYHFLNAFERDGKIHLDGCRYPRVPLFPNEDGTKAAGPDRAKLVRFTLGLADNSDRIAEEVLDGAPTEFARIDDRAAGRENRHGYFAATLEEDGGFAFDTIYHADLATGARRKWSPGGGAKVIEPVFAPLGAGEGEGLLLTLVWRPETNTSDLVFLDAADVSAGPVATAQLPVRIPFGFHGNWHAA